MTKSLCALSDEMRQAIYKKGLLVLTAICFLHGQSFGDTLENALITDVPGCTYSAACNYNSEATIDDGSCEFTSCIVFGCIYPSANNYNSLATDYDGSCDFSASQVEGCTYAISSDYNPLAFIDDGSCIDLIIFCPADLNGDLSVNSTDLLLFLGSFSTICN